MDRSDIYYTLPDILRYPDNTNTLNTRRSEHVNLPPQKTLKIFCKLDKSEADGTIEFHYQAMAGTRLDEATIGIQIATIPTSRISAPPCNPIAPNR